MTAVLHQIDMISHGCAALTVVAFTGVLSWAVRKPHGNRAEGVLIDPSWTLIKVKRTDRTYPSQKPLSLSVYGTRVVSKFIDAPK